MLEEEALMIAVFRLHNLKRADEWITIPCPEGRGR
jgi:hypothetical protein